MQLMLDDGEWQFDALADLVLESDEAIVLCAPSGEFLLANKGASDVVGVPAETMAHLRVDSFGRDTMHEFQRIAVDAVATNGIELTVRRAVLANIERRGPQLRPDDVADRDRRAARSSRSASASRPTATSRPGCSAPCSRPRPTAW